MVFDHSQTENLYESRFGANWRRHVKMSTEVKKYRDVLDLAQHMYDEGMRRHPDGNFGSTTMPFLFCFLQRREMS